MATPVFRREASMASTRIYRNVRIAGNAFNIESTNSKTTVLLARINNGQGDEKYSQVLCCYRNDDIRHPRGRSKLFRNDKRVKPNRDAGFGTARRLFVKFPNPGQADCESISAARRV